MKHQKQNSKGIKKKIMGPTSRSAEAVFSNEDLLSEILLRVPARSLVRFKCVSKYWLGLISGQKFCYNHSTQNRSMFTALYFHLGTYTPDNLKSISHCSHRKFPSLSFLSDIKRAGTIMVIHTLNGLTLCSHGWTENYIVCNLTTQKYRIISQPTEMGHICSLAYDPAVSPYYKIVSFGSNHIYIYSSEKLSWTQFHAPEIADIYPVSSTFFNGSVHCVNSDYYLRFEVDNEKLTKTLLPSEPPIGYVDETKFFGECGGNLLLVQDAFQYMTGFNILQMEMETNRWILKRRVSLRHIAQAFPDERFGIYLLTVLKGSRKGDIILVFLVKGKVIVCYPKCKKFKTLCDTPDEFSRLEYLQIDGAYHHFESLCPV